jgi:hypothetical protein
MVRVVLYLRVSWMCMWRAIEWKEMVRVVLYALDQGSAPVRSASLHIGPVWLSSQASQARINLARPPLPRLSACRGGVWLVGSQQPGQLGMVFGWLLMYQIQNMGMQAPCLVACIQHGGLTTSLEWCAYHHPNKCFYTCATSIQPN